MRKVIQKKIVDVIQPEIAVYYCDICGDKKIEMPSTINCRCMTMPIDV